MWVYFVISQDTIFIFAPNFRLRYSYYINFTIKYMRFEQVGRTAGDETTPYKVIDFKSSTVGEFIQEVLKESPNEWGYISVVGHFYQSRKKGSCEYRYGKLLSEMPKELLNVEIREVLACGGWSRMDYTINWG